MKAEGFPEGNQSNIFSIAEARAKREGQNEKEEKIERETFDAQFRNFEMIPFRDTEFEAIDIIPETISDPVPVLFVPGFAKSPRSYEEALFALYKSGRRVIGISAPVEHVKVTKNEKGEFPEALAERAQAILHVLQVKNTGPVDVFGHSEGGVNAMIATLHNDVQFRNFMLVTPPSMTQKKTYADIAHKGFKNALQTAEKINKATSSERERYESSQSDTWKWIWKADVRELMSAVSTGRIEITHVAKKLTEKGHRISIIAGTDDEMLPMKEFQRTEHLTVNEDTGNIERKTRSREDMGGIDGFYAVKGGHDGIVVDGRIGALGANALEALAKKLPDAHKNIDGGQDEQENQSRIGA